MKLKQILALDWDAIAGVIAAVTAIVLHLLHIIDATVMVTIAVVMIALLFIRDLRRERAMEHAYATIEENGRALHAIRAALQPSDAVLVGPAQLRAASERFAAHAHGEMTWFHVCLSMFRPQPLFDTLLRPAIENPQVTAVQFILDASQQGLWESEVLPKVAACGGRDKVRPPIWTTIDESVSVIIADGGPGGRAEGLLSFWGEPFMTHSADRQVPRYIFHVQPHSELMPRLAELVRNYRFAK
ncbi:MAG: hypothetical protein ACOY5W_09985 [Pseudomonadota bacterium]